MRSDGTTDVLVVGGGPVGLATAIGLRRFGVDCTVIERHDSTLDFPKGRRVTVRTMEILRQWGLEPAVADAALPRAESLFAYRGPTLLADDFVRQGVPGPGDRHPASPTQEVICSQERLEPILLKAARASGADVRHSTELESFRADDESVEAGVVDRKSGERRTLECQWLVGADGSQSLVRARLGIGWVPIGPGGDRVSVLFRAPLADRMADRLSGAYYLSQPKPGTTVAAVDNEERWLLLAEHDPTRPFGLDDAAELVGAAIGADDVPVEPLEWRLWRRQAALAEHFALGRVILAGDSAHVTTPLGGLGMNCGVADAHNLAWKLAAVVAGFGRPALVATYEHERRPAAAATVEASLGASKPPAPIDGIVLGARYDSAAITPDGTPPPDVADPVGEYVPLARPGHRAPHVEVHADGRRCSTLDLFGDGFTLLCGPDSPLPGPVGSEAARLGVPFTAVALDDPAFLATYGLSDDGAVLVRPDGYVAARVRHEPDADGAAMVHALRRALGLDEGPAH